MNRPLRNKERRIAWMLIAAFTWLFTVSLVLFHKEHVLGQHLAVKAEFFISPKSKDKENLGIKFVKPVLKFNENGGSGLASCPDDFTPYFVLSGGTTIPDLSSFALSQGLCSSGPLRAPPLS